MGTLSGADNANSAKSTKPTKSTKSTKPTRSIESTKAGTSVAPEASTSSNTSSESSALNAAIIVGELVSDLEQRTLPGGTKLVNFSVTVRRPDTATTSVPVAWYDPPARTAKWELGDRLIVIGSVVRRFYQSNGRVGSTTELVVKAADKATKAKLARLSGVHLKAITAVVGDR